MERLRGLDGRSGEVADSRVRLTLNDEILAQKGEKMHKQGASVFAPFVPLCG
jgi:hypothetical protein